MAKKKSTKQQRQKKTYDKLDKRIKKESQAVINKNKKK